ncbi:MAG: macro domain-containing protein [Nautiliaceae bacterium]
MFEIVKGDIKNFRGDYIINPSNTILKLGSGVSGVLKIMCPMLQKVMDEWIEKHGFLNPGEIAISVYPCEEYEWAIHAAVMDYRPGAVKIAPNYKRIEKICKNTAEYLNDKDALVITPYLGTGVGGLDKTVVREIMKNYFEPVKAKVVLVERM